MNDSAKFSRSLVARFWRGFHCKTTRATTRNIDALIEMRSGAPSWGSRKPPNAGPTILERLACTPPRVTAEGSSSLLTMSGTTAPHTGAAKAIPIPSAKMQKRTAPGFKTSFHAPRARSADHAPCHSTALTITVRRLTMSARAPAGSVNKKNGVEAAVATRESKKGEAPKSLISHVEVTSCAERNVPDSTLASQRRQKAAFRRANQVEVDFFSIAAGRRVVQSNPHRSSANRFDWVFLPSTIDYSPAQRFRQILSVHIGPQITDIPSCRHPVRKPRC